MISQLLDDLSHAFSFSELIANDKGNPVNSRILFVNHSWESIFGVKRENVIDKLASEALPEFKQLLPSRIGTDGKVVTSGEGESHNFFSPVTNKWYSVDVFSVEKGFFATVFTDNTPLQENERMLNQAQELAHLGYWELDLKTNVLTWSDEVYRIFGFKPQEFRPTYSDFLKSIHPDDRAAVNDAYSGFFREKKDAYEIQYRVIQPLSKAIRWVLGKGYLTKNLNGEVIRSFGMILDVTDRMKFSEQQKQLMTEIQKERDKLSALVNSMQDEVWYADSEKKFTLANPAALQAFVLNRNDPVNIENFAASLEVLRPDGTPRPIEDAPPLRALRGEVVTQLEEIIRLPSTGELRYRQVSAAPVKDALGKIVGSVSVVRDITERKRVEDERERLLAERTAMLKEKSQVTEELMRSNRELEQFAYVASHDLQEPLRMVSSFAALLREKFSGKLDETTNQYLAFTIEGAQRMQALVSDLLTFSRVSNQPKEPVVVDALVVLDQALANLNSIIIETKADVTHDNMPAVLATPVQLAQVFQNLISNAIKFKRPEVSPKIHVGVIKVITPQEIASDPQLTTKKSPGFWRFSVSDNGIGIDPRFSNKIFQIFQRLHKSGKYPGTGIGLAICKKIVEQHGGRIWFESELGKGTTFFFTIPVIPE